MLFGFMFEKVTIDFVFFLRKLLKEYCGKGMKLYVFCGSGESSGKYWNEQEKNTRRFC